MANKRTKNEMFEVILTDAVATAYEVPGLKANKAVSTATLRKLLDKAGLLNDVSPGRNR